jgi:hypothetical protein
MKITTMPLLTPSSFPNGTPECLEAGFEADAALKVYIPCQLAQDFVYAYHYSNGSHLY